jgi:hypothetical protein
MFNFTNDQVIQVIIKLNRDTSTGKIKWVSLKGDNISFPFDAQVIGKVYRTLYNTKYFQLFKFKHKTYSPDFDQFYVTSDIRLEITDQSGLTEWEFPYDAALHDLYETVRMKTGDIDQMLDSFLTT